MKVLLLQNMRYLPSHGGANRSNRLLLEELAARDHDCVVVAPLAATTAALSVAGLQADLAVRGVRPDRISDEAVVFTYRGVEAHVIVRASRLAPYARSLADRWRPDRVLVPSDDPGQLMLGTALRACPDRVVYLVHTLQQLPFGPRTFYPSDSGTRMVRRVAGVVSVSQAAQDYLRTHAGLDSTLIHPPVYGCGPFPDLGDPAGPVLMVNPCAYKGLAVLLALADAAPHLAFRAVPTWGTTAADRAALAARANITLVPPVDELATLLAGAGALLMPSLWDETFGYTAVEAMLHGVPVLASAVGGLTEAMLGVPHLLPVRPITAYRPQTDDEPFPAPVVPAQDAEPWLAALRRLRDEPGHHAAVAAQGRQATARFVAGLDPGAFAAYLAALPIDGGGTAAADGSPAAGGSPDRDGNRTRAAPPRPEPVAGADDRRAALARLLAQRRAEAGTNRGSDR